MGRFDINETLKDIERIMQVSGSWPKQSPSNIYKLTGFLTIFAKASLATILLIHVIINHADLQTVSFGLCCSITVFNGVLKLLVVVAKKSNFFEILECLKDPILALHENHLDIYLQQKIRLCNLFRPMFFIAGVATGIIIIVSPILDGRSERPLPLPFPMDMKEQPLVVYYSIWCYQTVVVLLTCSLIPCFDGIVFTFIVIAAGQLRIVREKIINAADCWPSEPQHLQIQQKCITVTNNLLRECVRHHVATERYIAAIEKTFTVEFLIQLVASLLVTCIIGFNFILLPVKSLDFGRCLLFFVAVIIQLIFFCVPGNEIINQSEKIRDACYMSKWTDCDPSVRKTLFIIMERSKRPLQLTAANFVPLSLGTLLSVLKSAFSYFTVLMQLYADSSKA